MENIEFDFEKVLKMQFDKAVLNLATAEIADLTKEPKTAATARDMLMVFINHGVELPIAIDILKDVADIVLKSQGGDEDDKK